MRKLLNTVYVTNEKTYLSLDGENLVCRLDDEVILRIPFDNVENIVCFNYLGCSPALMGKCVSKMIPINFMSPNGKFLAKIYGETKGNVFLRVQQIDSFRRNNLSLAKNVVVAKISNTIQLIKRTTHDNADLREDDDLCNVIEVLKESANRAFAAKDLDELRGIEGRCAKEYFAIFSKLITSRDVTFTFEARTKRPPLDPVNAVLSFLYSLHTAEYAAALETVGLDSYIGFFHSLRSGRCSLACDLVEESRCIVERFVLSTLNLKMIGEKDFDKQITGAIFLNESGRKKILARWQEKKRTSIKHPYLKEKIPLGLLPYVQSNLLAKYVRGDMEEYYPFLQKQV